jgi:uncharacterized integral membrane protein
VVYYRHEHLKGVKNFLFYGVLPALGALIMLALLVAACINYSDPSQGKTAIHGIGAPLVFGVGAIVFGLILMALVRMALPDFFRRKREVFKPGHAPQV